MTAKQREATDILLRLFKEEMVIDGDEFYKLLDFVIEKKEVVYIPYYTPSYYYNSLPAQPNYENPLKYQITCKL